MADNVTFQPTPATPANGTVVATDDVTGVHYQYVKLADGTLNSGTAIASGNGVHGAALRVTIASDSTGVIAVTDNGGSLTVDATSLPLPTGASTAAKQDTGNTSLGTIDTNTAASAASLSVLDDWDETDRAKVNLIAGQVGVAGGTGGTNASVLRVTQATDVNVNTVEVAPTAVYAGQKNVTTAGTQVALAASQVVKSVTIKAKVVNTGDIYVGDLNVDSTTGIILSPGESVSLDIANVATPFIDSAVNGEGVSWIAVG